MAMMKPILFNTEMVRAILDGRKTVTRRPVKIRLKDNEFSWLIITNKHSGEFIRIETLDDWENEVRWIHSPFSPGDILYVRQTWCKVPGDPPYVYRATCHDGVERKWRPSVHMPKEAARIFLRVTNVRVERLQDMNNDDALAEGCTGLLCKCEHAYIAGGTLCCTDCMNTGWEEPPLLEFMGIWNSTIKKSDLDRYGWDANPWCWVIEFERCEKPKGE